MSEEVILEFAKHRVADTTLENLKISLFTDIVNDFGIEIEDLELFEKVVRYIRDGVIIERAHYGEDLMIVKPEIDGDQES